MKSNRCLLAAVGMIAAFGCVITPANAAHAHVAVAANFHHPMQELKRQFETTSKHTLTISSGSTGQLYAQSLLGAPFDVFLAADQMRPAALARKGHADANSQITYALGRLALIGPRGPMTDGKDALRHRLYRRLAIARPGVAPYGDAALQVLNALGMPEHHTGKRLVYAHSVGQAYAMAVSGAADMALVAASFLSHPSRPAWHWRVPSHLHTPITQDAILTQSGTHNQAARAFLSFLTSPRGQTIIAAFGYGIP